MINYNREFRAARLALDMTQETATLVLGKCRRTIQYYEAEGNEVDTASLLLLKLIGLSSTREQGKLIQSAIEFRQQKLLDERV